MKLTIFLCLTILSLNTFAVTEEVMSKISDKAWTLQNDTEGCPAALGLETRDIEFNPNSGERKSAHYNIRSFYKGLPTQALEETSMDFQISLNNKKGPIKQCFSDITAPKTCVKMDSSVEQDIISLNLKSRTKVLTNDEVVKVKSERSYQFDTKNNQMRLVIHSQVKSAEETVICEYKELQKTEHASDVADSDRSIQKDLSDTRTDPSSTNSQVILK